MKFIYSPEGADVETWDYEPDKLMSPEAEAIERVTGMTFGEWKNAVLRDSMRAIRALLWVYLKRTRPTLKFDEVQFSMAEVALEMDDDEKRQIIEAADKMIADGEEVSDEQLAELDELRASLPPLEIVPDHVSADEPGEDVDAGGGQGNSLSA
jgi:hypothetical protein